MTMLSTEATTPTCVQGAIAAYRPIDLLNTPPGDPRLAAWRRSLDAIIEAPIRDADDALARLTFMPRWENLDDFSEAYSADLALIRQELRGPDLEAFAQLCGEKWRVSGELAGSMESANKAARKAGFEFVEEVGGGVLVRPLGTYAGLGLEDAEAPAGAKKIAESFSLAMYGDRDRAAFEEASAAELAIIRDCAHLARRLRANLAALAIDQGVDARAAGVALARVLLIFEADLANEYGIGEEPPGSGGLPSA